MSNKDDLDSFDLLFYSNKSDCELVESPIEIININSENSQIDVKTYERKVLNVKLENNNSDEDSDCTYMQIDEDYVIEEIDYRSEIDPLLVTFENKLDNEKASGKRVELSPDLFGSETEYCDDISESDHVEVETPMVFTTNSDEGSENREEKLSGKIDNDDDPDRTEVASISSQTENLSKRKKYESRKLKRNSGEPYTTAKGETRERRISKELGNCKRKCRERVSDELRTKCFTEYWGLKQYTLRLAYLTKCLKIQSKARITNLKNPKRDRNITVVYHLTNSETREEINVCKTCFLSVLGEKKGIVETVLKKSQQGSRFIDNRGKSHNKHKISPKQQLYVISFINSFPKYESHYSRAHTTKKYLPIGLNLWKMYDMYSEKYSESKVSLSKFRQIFKTCNLKFKHPQLDTCHKCDKFAMKLKLAKDEADKINIEKDRDHHQECAELAYEAKRIDKSDPLKTVLAIDLQQCLPTPYLRSSIAFYKRSLWTFNLTIRNCDDNSTHCFVWHEGMSGRGANEISSCIYKYLTTVEKLKRHIVIYSDTCAGQNRNNIVCSMMQYLIKTIDKFDVIEHKFLEPGHTHLECDSDHKIIEDKKKRTNMEIFHPHDWAQLMRSCGRKKKFNVIEMTNSDFIDFADLLKTINKKPNKTICGKKISWNYIRLLR